MVFLFFMRFFQPNINIFTSFNFFFLIFFFNLFFLLLIFFLLIRYFLLLVCTTTPDTHTPQRKKKQLCANESTASSLSPAQEVERRSVGSVTVWLFFLCFLNGWPLSWSVARAFSTTCSSTLTFLLFKYYFFYFLSYCCCCFFLCLQTLTALVRPVSTKILPDSAAVYQLVW